MKRVHFATQAAFAFLALTPLIKANVIASLGNTASGFTTGSHPTTAAVLAALAGSPAPFNAFCGSDAAANCAANWTFSYLLPAGQLVSGATLTLGISDIDSAAAGNQVASFLIGATDLTAALNTVSEGLNGGTGATNGEYDVLTVTLPSAALSALQSGSANVSLSLQGPGLGVLGSTTFNGAGLVFSTLDIQTASPTPEPAELPLLLTAAGALIAMRARHKKNRSRPGIALVSERHL